MKIHRYLIYPAVAVLLGGLFAGCRPRMDVMAKAEKVFIKMVDKTAQKLDLTEEQKTKLEKLKLDIRKNFDEGKIEKKNALTRIKEEGAKDNPDIRKMTSTLQESFLDEARRINRAFDLMLSFQANLNEAQRNKLTRMISDWVREWK